MLDKSSLKELTVLAIDPGLHNVGIAIFKVWTEPAAIQSITAWSLHSSTIPDRSGLDDMDYVERTRIRRSMAIVFQRILEEYKPDLVVSESPFFDRRKPGSFAVLTEVIVTLFDTVANYNPVVLFSMVEPQLVKKVLGVAGQKGKEVVQEAMEKTPEIISKLLIPLDELDDHGIDAVAVGYTYLIKKSGLFTELKEKKK